MTIDWLSLLIVAATSIVAAAVVATLFATGIKLLATPPTGAADGGSARDDETDELTGRRPRAATVGGAVCIGLSAIAVLWGVYLIVPALHG